MKRTCVIIDVTEEDIRNPEVIDVTEKDVRNPEVIDLTGEDGVKSKPCASVQRQNAQVNRLRGIDQDFHTNETSISYHSSVQSHHHGQRKRSRVISTAQSLPSLNKAISESLNDRNNTQGRLDGRINRDTERSEEEEIEDVFDYNEEDWNDAETIPVLSGASKNKYGQPHPKNVRHPENLDCLIEKFRRQRSSQHIGRDHLQALDCSGIRWVEIDSHIEKDMPIIAADGTDVELADGTYLRVKKIRKDVLHDKVVLFGWKFHPTADLQPALPTMQDEVCWLLEMSQNSTRATSGICLTKVLASEVIQKREIHITNIPENREQSLETHQISETGVLRCRWKLVVTPHLGEYPEFALQAIMQADADSGHGIPDSELRYSWRGFSPWGNQKFTFVDGFCGAGGASAGAQQAGLEVVRAFDIAEKPVDSFRKNFGETLAFLESVDKYCQRRGLPYVDVSHYSPCCQPYSPAHTRIGKNDEANEAASLCIETLLEVDKPRVTTFENTFGLYTHHPDLMYPILGQYTAKGYSIRFRVLNMADWGLPQPRRRLVLIASCPGEQLPNFAQRTHAPMGLSLGNVRLNQYVGLGEAIKPLELAVTCGIDLPDHDPGSARQINRPPFSAHQAKCVTCKGGDNYHPSGQRVLTVRELAVIQGFPLDHIFSSKGGRTEKVSQIGNGFPALFTRQLFSSIVRQMEEADKAGTARSNKHISLDRAIMGMNGGLLWLQDTSPMELQYIPDNDGYLG